IQARELDEVLHVQHARGKQEGNARQGEGHTKLPEKQRAKDEPGKDGSGQHLLAGETGKGREPGDGSYQENVSDGLVHAVVTCGVTVTSLDRARWSCR